ncbi:hypothetical protein DY000_02005054 [Brassica cretica]|uniref:SWIM-type domain-containing protein n=1 Tax=Brassica cretica TaxID=69181 RepID=A0ABQ7C2U8_BRACR|nr:hypothetical protein DY000_02005054 [Brassica cretica]
MMHIYTTCGVWEFGATTGWVFSADEKGARLLLLESSSTIEVFKRMVLEDFDMEEDSLPDLELSYLPIELINTSTCPPVIIANDRQLQNFVGFVQKCVSTRLCVTSKAKVENLNEPDFDLNKSPADSSTAQEEGNSVGRGNEPAPVFVEMQYEKKKEKIRRVEVDEDAYDVDTMISAKEDKHNMSKYSLLNVVKKGQLFENKTLLKATFEICAMKHNFHYEVIKTDIQLWYVRCEDNACNWCVRAECLKDYAYFIIKKYVGEHTCAPLSKTKLGKTASAKTIGSLIMHRYEGVKEGPKCNDIIQIMLRGIPERSYGKIPKYLHMLREANPGTHSSYEIDSKGRFRYLFIAFGQSIRGFNRVIRRVIAVDGTFLKNKYKGVLLVATAVDGNSNLYPLAFGISKHNHPLTIDVEKKIERRTEKGKTFAVYPVSDGRLLVRGDKIDCLVDLDRRTCSCGKYNLMKIPCRHAIKAGFHVGRQPHTLTDLMYTTEAWREASHDSINPIAVPEDAWSIPEDVVQVNVLPPESRKSVGRNRKRRYETVEDKIRSSQTLQKRQPRKCSRCGISGHNRATCWSVQVCKLWCLKVQYCIVSYGFFF